MPVDRSHINGFATGNSSLYQALTALANHADALEKAVGVQVTGGKSSALLGAPPMASWTITAANGHFVVQITNPDSAAAAIQHQIRASVSSAFDAASGVATYTLGLGETTRDVVDPNASKYWQIRSRYQGSSWTGWRTYATASGVVALNAGPLKTS